MAKKHHYKLTVKWTGNEGTGTAHYSNYERSHIISVANKADLLGSSDPAFRGDSSRHNPEDLLLASLSSCHMLWYLHLCSASGVTVIDYVDHAKGVMVESENGSGYFSEVELHPVVTVAEKAMIEKANALHKEANKRCFIANSVNFPVRHKAISKAIEEKG